MFSSGTQRKEIASLNKKMGELNTEFSAKLQDITRQRDQAQAGILAGTARAANSELELVRLKSLSDKVPVLEKTVRDLTEERDAALLSVVDQQSRLDQAKKSTELSDKYMLPMGGTDEVFKKCLGSRARSLVEGRDYRLVMVTELIRYLVPTTSEDEFSTGYNYCRIHFYSQSK